MALLIKTKKQVSSYSFLSIYGQIIHLKANGKFVLQKKKHVEYSLDLREKDSNKLRFFLDTSQYGCPGWEREALMVVYLFEELRMRTGSESPLTILLP